jgi:hypothetical protein
MQFVSARARQGRGRGGRNGIDPPNQQFHTGTKISSLPANVDQYKSLAVLHDTAKSVESIAQYLLPSVVKANAMVCLFLGSFRHAIAAALIPIF